MNLNYNPWTINFRVRVRGLSRSQSIFNDFGVPVCLLLLTGVVLYFICFYIVYHL